MPLGRIIHQAHHGERSVFVRKDSETGEYRCRLAVYDTLRPEADYFTDDREDAFATAVHMARGTSPDDTAKG